MSPRSVGQGVRPAKMHREQEGRKLQTGPRPQRSALKSVALQRGERRGREDWESNLATAAARHRGQSFFHKDAPSCWQSRVLVSLPRLCLPSLISTDPHPGNS